MTCSSARLAANRQNALKSTGPKSPEGKAVSRLNAFRHGLAGGGVLLGPLEDAAKVARRSAALVQELGALGEMEEILAHRVALLSVRMEEAVEVDRIASATCAAMGRQQFDQDRRDDLDVLIDGLETEDYRDALRGLEESTEGLDHLTGVWNRIWVALGSTDEATAKAARDRVATWLGRTDADLRPAVEAEAKRLRWKADTTAGPREDELTIARHQAGVLASFDTSRESVLARRYEAAAERGMYQAIRAIRELRREREASPAPPPDALPKSAPTPTQPQPAPAALGSFRASDFAPPPPRPAADFLATEPRHTELSDRNKRPDLRKLRRNRR